MKGLLRIFALLMAASMLIWLAGCGGEEEEEEDKGPAPTVSSVSVSEGQELAGNASIVVTFSKKMGSAEVMVSGAAGTGVLSADGKTLTWTPTGDIPPGAHTVTISGEDTFAQALEGAVPINITAKAPDPDPPVLDDNACDPPNGEDGVDPADYPEGVTIGFNEALSEVKVSSVDPEFGFSEEFDGMTLVLKFLKYSMPNETEFLIKVIAKDLAGNEAELEYSFTTMSKEEA